MLALLLVPGRKLLHLHPAAPAPVERFTIELTVAEIDTISRGLLELPYKDAMPVVVEIQKQINKAIEAKRECEAPK